MQAHAGDFDEMNVPRAQRRSPAPSLQEIAAAHPAHRSPALLAAYQTGEYSYAQIAHYFGVHFTTVGRVVRRAGSP